MKSNDKSSGKPLVADPLVAGRDPAALETFHVCAAPGGWRIVPTDVSSHPLLARLFGAEPLGGVEPQVAPADDLTRTFEWANLAEGVRLIGDVAREAGLGVRVCGDRRRRPTVQLWRKAPVAREALARPFSQLVGDAAKWGVSDFYPQAAQALRAALLERGPFDTGWYSVKKEIQSARVLRAKRGGRLSLSASASMDDWPDLLDTALWQARGKALGASSGVEVLTLWGLDDAQADAWMHERLQELSVDASLEEGNCVTLSAELSPRAGYAAVCAKLEGLAQSCEEQLRAVFDDLVEACERRLTELRSKLGASCVTCRHFKGKPVDLGTPHRSTECGHPRFSRLLSTHQRFPFAHGCKFWVARMRRKPGT